ncbi:hypothetical protein T484DRAFT_1923674 [Baffinella frigidus]|nr:hypothetical protein T484DRAFT_1923674 [Cryptophyta sp. CCMP2293]
MVGGEDHAGDPLEDPDQTGYEPHQLRLAARPGLLLALDVFQEVPGQRLGEGEVLPPEVLQASEGSRERLPHPLWHLLVETPSDEEVDSVVERRLEERWLRDANIGQRRHNRDHLVVMLSGFEEDRQPRDEPAEEGRDGVRGAERQHLRDDREDRREAERVLHRVQLHGRLEEHEEVGAVAPERCADLREHGDALVHHRRFTVHENGGECREDQRGKVLAEVGAARRPVPTFPAVPRIVLHLRPAEILLLFRLRDAEARKKCGGELLQGCNSHIWALLNRLRGVEQRRDPGCEQGGRRHASLRPILGDPVGASLLVGWL